MVRACAHAARVTHFIATAASRSCQGVAQLLRRAWETHPAQLMCNAAGLSLRGQAEGEANHTVRFSHTPGPSRRPEHTTMASCGGPCFA